MQRRDTGWRLGTGALGWLGGTALQLQEAALNRAPAYAAALAAGLIGLIVLGVSARRRTAPRPGLRADGARAGSPPEDARKLHGTLAVLATGMAAAALAWGVAGLHAGVLLGNALAPALEGQDLVVTGVVASLPQRSAAGVRFRFRVEEAESSGSAVVLPRTLALGWYQGVHPDAAASQPQRELRAGQRWRFTVRLRRPHGSLNPHGFDYELALFEQGVRATGYVRDAPARLLDASAGFPVERLRQRVRDAIDAHVADRRAAGVLAALAVGDQGAIERDDWELFRSTGVAHLMSISGLHVTMLAWLAGVAARALWRRSGRAALRIATPHAAWTVGLVVAFGYSVFAGWGVPAQRTVLMLAAVALLRLGGVRWPLPLVLLGAAVVVTALDPWALLQPGFWLSFMAVGLLLASSGGNRDERAQPAAPFAWRSPRSWLAPGTRAVRGGVRTQLVATVGLAPLTLVFFQQISLVGFAANLIAIPLVTLVVTPLALAGALLPLLWQLAALGVVALTRVLEALASLPIVVWSVAAAPPWAALAGLVAALLLVLPIPWRARLLALPLGLPLLLPPHERPPEGSFDVLALDVGQGTAVLVRTRGHTLLYDAGPQYSSESDAGQRVVVPLLRATGERHIDRLVLSHRDSDHVGGTRAVVGAVAVGGVLTSLEPTHPLHPLLPTPMRCTAGATWLWDGVRFDVLAPPAAAYDAGLKPNALSCVVRVSAGGRSVFLAGDIERAQEGALVDVHGAALRSDVLIAPHHGSRTSSTERFIDAVRPRVVLFQAGYRNRFGHPAPDVVERYRVRGALPIATPACGAWLWRADDALPGRCQRDHARRYWHSPVAPP
ncbi:DNA internalization-related competence protein ComEC/Rec2 [Piscinibacter koreensis]|uniref:DNA internalization-related competence protein ComEC/Rec2 n=1 Tax=Piscinibacter koreensis TaxID=2742824 RepID=A0A7Y6NKY0_9BURK|nr:DNA internalization-related competence protein ComEC/Rec2 [Schlegelella koreensis]NUZ05019.1 DNA internalization-related competence protein ComEC/Rec2 [Schlegelella koreensis]